MEQKQETTVTDLRWVQSVIMPTDHPSPAAQLARFIELYGEDATVESVINRTAQPSTPNRPPCIMLPSAPTRTSATARTASRANRRTGTATAKRSTQSSARRSCIADTVHCVRERGRMRGGGKL